MQGSMPGWEKDVCLCVCVNWAMGMGEHRQISHSPCLWGHPDLPGLLGWWCPYFTIIATWRWLCASSFSKQLPREVMLDQQRRVSVIRQTSGSPGAKSMPHVLHHVTKHYLQATERRFFKPEVHFSSDSSTKVPCSLQCSQNTLLCFMIHMPLPPPLIFQLHSFRP